MTAIPERPECWCWTCDYDWREQQGGVFRLMTRFIVCPACGNKRCPRATHHDNDCTGSNEPNQEGSRYQYDVPGSGRNREADDT